MKATTAVLIVVVYFALLLLSKAQRRGQYRGPTRRPMRIKTTTLGGRWVPSRGRPVRRKPVAGRPLGNQGKGRKPASTTAKPRRKFNPIDNFIVPPLRRNPGTAPLQSPSWTHCIKRQQVTETWVLVQTAGYPDPIQGQFQCTWMFYTTRGLKLRISFYDLDLSGTGGGRCQSQFVDIIDLSEDTSQGHYCGDRIPGDYVSLRNQLRVDIHSDTTVVPYKGFKAGVRAEPATVASGTRQRSLLAHGPITTTTIKPKTTRRTTSKAARSTTVATSATTTTRAINSRYHRRPDRHFFGPYHAAPPVDTEWKTGKSGLSKLTIILLVVGLVCFVILLTALGFIFRKTLYTELEVFRGGRKAEKTDQYGAIAGYSDDATSDTYKLQALPGHSETGYPVRRKSVIFEDEWLESLKTATTSVSEFEDNDDDIFTSRESLSQQLQDTISRGSRDPIYEDSYDVETASLRSCESVRSSMRHPEHKTLRKLKIRERDSVLGRRKDDDDDDDVYAPASDSSAAKRASPVGSVVSNLSAGVGIGRRSEDMMRRLSGDAAIMIQSLLTSSKSLNDVSCVGEAAGGDEVVRAPLKRCASMTNLMVTDAAVLFRQLTGDSKKKESEEADAEKVGEDAQAEEKLEVS